MMPTGKIATATASQRIVQLEDWLLLEERIAQLISLKFLSCLMFKLMVSFSFRLILGLR
jgi:hypothetical protein